MTMANSLNFHEDCFACSQKSSHGLKLQFKYADDTVICQTKIDKLHQSYDGIVHGGIIATVLDATMIQCLRYKFSKNPFTNRLEIKYREPIPVDSQIIVNASLVDKRGKFCWVESNITNNKKVCAIAKGVFKLI
jgi:acyl-coenzyme A thioesterase PaaI-like protein